jgi:serum/glucocorticoid-regulated kinase 2
MLKASSIGELPFEIILHLCNRQFCRVLRSDDVMCRDLKPENVLIGSDGNLCLTDFGLSKESVQDNELVHTFVGTTEYLAPEILRQRGYTKAVDWWSLGVLLCVMHLQDCFCLC